MMKAVLESPALYYKLYVGKQADGSPLLIQDPTPAMILGSATHCLTLEPDRFDKLYCKELEGVDGRTKGGKKEKADWQLANIAKTILTANQYEKANRMAEAILAFSLTKEIISAAVKERAIVWEESGISQKCKPDLFIENYEPFTDLHVDIKTAANPRPTLRRSGEIEYYDWSPMADLHYDLQVAAHYPAGIEALTGRSCLSAILVVGTSEPYDVYFYNTVPWRPIGEAYRQEAISRIAECTQSGVWDDPLQHGVVQLNPNRWN
jgi:hypothetical protein